MTARLFTFVTAVCLAVAGLPGSAVAAEQRGAVHTEPAPAPTPAPDPAEANGWDATAPTPVEPAPIPTDPPPVVLQPTATAPLPAATPPPEPAPAPAPPVRDGHGLRIVGGIMMGVGGASLLFVALPAMGVRNVAQRRADRETSLAFSSRESRYARARRADDTMEGAFWVGAPLLVAGLAAVITGVVMRNNARARSQRVAAVPGGLAIRF